MSSSPVRPTPFEWIGGCLILDFINTVSWGEPEDPGERLPDYAAVVAWAVEAGVVPEVEGGRFLARAAEARAVGGRAVHRAWRLRALGHAIFSAVARDEAVDEQDLVAFNEVMGAMPVRIGRSGEGGFHWEWPLRASAGRLDAFLAPIVWSGAELLIDHERLARVKTCANDRCGWLFIDQSRRGNRRWCDMRDCGNRAKARRYYRRHRAGS